MVYELHVRRLDNGHYLLLQGFTYTSPRYQKTITLKDNTDSDGATGTIDVFSRSWWIHDELCKTGKWDDGTKLTNWECSHVVTDILKEEGFPFYKRYLWATGTWLFGGGKARKNGMW